MNGVKYMIVITEREYSEIYSDFFRQNKLNSVFGYFANGTANAQTLSFFGLEKTEKTAFGLMVPDEKIPEIKQGLLNELKLDGIGKGIAIFLPVDGLGGEYAKKKLLGEADIKKREAKAMEENLSKAVLLIAIADKGYSELVMDAARAAGATGGTVVRAKGTGASIAKFFGISISEEKEMIYVVAKRECRDDIMHSIMEKAGRDTDAHGIVFSLPVDSICGIRGLE